MGNARKDLQGSGGRKRTGTAALGEGRCAQDTWPDKTDCGLVALLVVVADHVDDDSAREIKHIILAVGDVHPIRVRKLEPPLGNPSDFSTTSFKGVFTVQEIAPCLQVIRT